MPHNSFCISGMGRTGTKFLAETFNRASDWVVRHEPTSAMCPEKAKDSAFQVGRWPARDNYGEVNSYMRWSFMDLPVANRACLMRDPHDLTRAIYNRKKGKLSDRIRDELIEAYDMLDNWIQGGVRHFHFEHYTTDVITVLELAAHVGITGLELGENHCDKPVNATPAKRNVVKHFKYLPKEVREWTDAALGWCRREHYNEDGTPLIKLPYSE